MKKRFIFALFLALTGTLRMGLLAQTGNYLSTGGGFSSTDTVKIWSHGDNVSYSLVTLANQTPNTIDIGFVWDTISPFPSLWGAEIEYPLSNGYTSAKTGQFRLFANSSGAVPLIFFAFSHNNQQATGAVKLHLYQLNQPQDSLNIRFQMRSRPQNPIATDKIKADNFNIENLPIYNLYPNPAQNEIYLQKNQFIDNNIINNIEIENIAISIYSQTGELLTQKIDVDNNNLNQMAINTQNLAAGMYMVQIKTKNTIQIIPFVKKE